MAPLSKEDFDFIDKCFGKNKEHPIVYNPDDKHVGAERERGVIDCNEAAKKYGGVLLVEFPQKKRSILFRDTKPGPKKE